MSSENSLNNDTGGTSGKKSLSVSQLNPVFSYRVSVGGVIYVYLIRIQGGKVVLMSYDDKESEYVYGTLTLMSNTGYEADMLLSSAIRHWLLPNNPFMELANDSRAMRKLIKLVSQFNEGD